MVSRMRVSILLSAVRNFAVAAPFAFRSTARCGTRKPSLAVPTVITARAYMPGSRWLSGFLKTERMVKVSVVWLTAASIVSSVPVSG